MFLMTGRCGKQPRNAPLGWREEEPSNGRAINGHTCLVVISSRGLLSRGLSEGSKMYDGAP
jgi:hypothetical protein